MPRDKKKKKGDADAESGGESPGSPGDDADATPEEVVWMTDTSEQAAQARAEKQLTKAMADMVTQASVILHCRGFYVQHNGVVAFAFLVWKP